ncbi:MAG: type II toxin-antitoxin system death-on-curing family toxin [Chloroflexi bacterium]|nr:type II toxin-antitoxin system death-on-curing family toxin [Chloroflexota bacterium]
MNLLESALAQPQQGFNGKYLYRTIFDKAAALYFSLVKNHCLVDGNKRLALTSLAVFLTLNEYAFYVGRDEAVQFTVKLASGDDLDITDVLKWIRRNAIRFDRFLSMSEEEVMRWIGVVAGSLPHVTRSIELFKEFMLSDDDS